MPRKHHVAVPCDDDLWRAFKVRAMQQGKDLGDYLAELIAGELGVPAPQRPAAIAGQLVLPATRTKPSQARSGAPGASGAAATKPPAKRRPAKRKTTAGQRLRPKP